MTRKLLILLVLFTGLSGFMLIRHLSNVSAAATITVDSATDDGTGCTLREAIESANTDIAVGGCTAGSGANDVIEFDIAGAGPHTITPTSLFPDITTQVTIDGYTETGAVVNTADFPAALNGTLMIEIDGSSLPADSIALTLAAGSDGSTIRGLVINGVTGDGLLVNSESNVITGNYIGTNVAGLVDDGNTQHGIRVNDANNTIGGTTAASRNISSGNGFTGINISSANASGNTVQGNYIGVGADGTTDLGNSNQGVWVLNAGTATIGGTTTASGNLLSGNGAAGLELNGATGAVVSANRIGTDFDGDAALANAQEGIMMQGTANGNTIGGDTAAERNIISGNGGVGVQIIDSDSNVVSANYIGTSLDGEIDLGNGESGVSLASGASSNTIGGDTTDERNLISGNGNDGVRISGATSTPNTIIGNYIGTDDDGVSAIGNTERGVWLLGSSSGNTVGGDTAGERNVISGNGSFGVHLGTNDNDIFGNYIGANAAGSGIIPNATEGVYTDSTSGNDIGSSATGTGNTIAGNGEDGIELVAGSSNTGIRLNTIILNTQNGINIGSGSSAITIQGNQIGVLGAIDVGNGADGIAVDTSTSITIGGSTSEIRNVISGNNDDGISATASTLTIQGNYIGTSTDGTTDIGNTDEGIEFNNVDSQTIGGSSTGQGNVISGNNSDGIFLGAGSNGNSVVGNIIGLALDGTSDLGNGQEGLSISASGSNMIGGTTSLARNLISGNVRNGIMVTGDAADANVMTGNYIGPNITGAAVVANGGIGILIQSSADSNVIGGDTAEERNVISGNGDSGVHVTDAGTTANQVIGNYIGTSAAGTADLGNTADGVNLNNSASATIIGTATEGTRNVISGNNDDGIEMADNITSQSIINNYIGTSADGESDLGNSDEGISILATDNVTIGGTASGAGNVISGNGGEGIEILIGGDNAIIQGNRIGTDDDGLSEIPNASSGIRLAGNAATVGGTTTAARNIIAGNDGTGLSTVQAVGGGINHTIQGNYFGLGSDGTTIMMNGTTTTNGNIVLDTGSNTVGGTATGARNVIAGASIAGVMITSFSPAAPNSGNVIQGNYIGTLADGSVAAGSGGTASGIFVIGAVEDTLIGGTAAGAGNLVRGNGAGIGVASVTSLGVNLNTVSILNNSIYENDGGPFSELGIDLFQTVDFVSFSEVGVTPNDAADPDTVTNYYQNFPVIDSITTDGDEVTFTYDLDVNPADPDVDGYQVDFYASTAADPSGYGEGEIHLGADTGLTGDVSNRSFTIPSTDLANGTYYFSAVTTPTDTSGDGFGSSSEFSAVLAATITDSSGGGGGGGDSGGAGVGSVSLADTGRNVFMILGLGVLLIATGYLVYRRRAVATGSK